MNRDISISIAKAIAILLMVLGHSGLGISYVTKVIYAFHMPIFFILSGMCFKERYLNDGLRFCKRKIIGIYWPYIKWSIVFLLLHNVFYHWHIYDADYGYLGIGSMIYTYRDFWEHAKEILLRMEGHEQLLGTFWFMKQLFWGNLLFYGVLRICREKRWLTMGVLLLLAMIMRIFHISVPCVEWTWMIAYSAFFIASGYAFTSIVWNYNKWYVYLIGMLIWLLGAYYSMHLEMYAQSKFTIIPYFVLACAGSLIIILVSRYIANEVQLSKMKKAIAFVGNHTFEIMALHFLSFKIVSILIVCMHNLPIEHIAEFPVIAAFSKYGWWFAYLVVGITLPICYAYVKMQMMTYLQKYKKGKRIYD